MLILRRKAGEAIWIGDNIKVTILANDEGGVRLAVAKAAVEGAPKTLKEAISKDEAEELKKKLEEAGAKVELK